MNESDKKQKLHEIDINVREYWFELKTIWNAFVVSEARVEWFLDDEVDGYFEKRVHGLWMRANAGTLKHFNNQKKSRFPEDIEVPPANVCWNETLANMMYRKETAKDANKVVISNVIDAIFIKGIERAREKFGSKVSFSKAMSFVMNIFDTKVVELGFENYAKRVLIDATASERKAIRSGDAEIGGEGEDKHTLFDLIGSIESDISEVERRELDIIAEEVAGTYARELIADPKRMVALVLSMSCVSINNKQIEPLIRHVVGASGSSLAQYWKQDRARLGEVVSEHPAELDDDPEAKHYVGLVATGVALEIGKKWFFSEKRYEELFSLLEQ